MPLLYSNYGSPPFERRRHINIAQTTGFSYGTKFKIRIFIRSEIIPLIYIKSTALREIDYRLSLIFFKDRNKDGTFRVYWTPFLLRTSIAPYQQSNQHHHQKKFCLHNSKY